MEASSLCTSIHLYETPERLYLLGRQNEGGGFRKLTIDKAVISLALEEAAIDADAAAELTGRLIKSGATVQRADGILGFIRFLEGYYLVLVTEKHRVANIGGRLVFAVDKVSLISCLKPEVAARLRRERGTRSADEVRYKQLFQQVLFDTFFFSYTWDLTRCVQDQTSLLDPTAQPVASRTSARGERKRRSACKGDRDRDRDRDGETARHTRDGNLSFGATFASTRSFSPDRKDSRCARRLPFPSPSPLHGRELPSASPSPFPGPARHSFLLSHLPSPSHVLLESAGVSTASGLGPRRSILRPRVLKSAPTPRTVPPRDASGNGGHICNGRFVTNAFLLRPLIDALKPAASAPVPSPHPASHWALPAIQGAVEQRFLAIGQRLFSITLIARRSRFHVGPRYFKRGVNGAGRVANEVECEQLVVEDAASTARVGRGIRGVASIVQLRGSIPLFWGHINTVSPKPDLVLHSEVDPSLNSTKLHFDDLTKRYGSPIVVLNLVRDNPETHKEVPLARAFEGAIAHVQSLWHQEDAAATAVAPSPGGSSPTPTPTPLPPSPPLTLSTRTPVSSFQSPRHLNSQFQTAATAAAATPGATEGDGGGGGVCEGAAAHVCREVKYLAFDWLGQQKDSGTDGALKLLFEWAAAIVDMNGFFLDHVEYGARVTYAQEGVPRVNCIDCLDRTNIGMFAIAQEALYRQLMAMGCLPSPEEHDQDEDVLGSEFSPLPAPLLSLLMDLWGSIGDPLAHQYGGSAALHRPQLEESEPGQWKSQTRSNALIAVRRYISNVFSDLEKQRAVDLFCGKFIPRPKGRHIWELDLYPTKDALLQEGSRVSPPHPRDGGHPHEGYDVIEDVSAPMTSRSRWSFIDACALCAPPHIPNPDVHVDVPAVTCVPPNVRLPLAYLHPPEGLTSFDEIMSQPHSSVNFKEAIPRRRHRQVHAQDLRFVDRWEELDAAVLEWQTPDEGLFSAYCNIGSVPYPRETPTSFFRNLNPHLSHATSARSSPTDLERKPPAPRSVTEHSGNTHMSET
ncbi:unnamed protein product [Vitrella brassicaformis CCMP3155]|uniref:SAC domain-containing protein n=3 Tax=Vitrella brassicaformis TaxID=1169539 RepID=A0A0G4EXI7_VITBC|nr:unnamed protein product [Vitrella brassicaformis CCMP3155]|eukprot:CEM03309.1 unnamed protein product [Vitrella brassicaformis CCMP3155]